MTKEQSALALLKSVDSKLGRFYDALTDTLVRELDSINGKALAKLIERLETQLERDADGRIARTSKNLTRLAGLDADYVKVMDKFGHRKAITAFVGEFPKQLPSLAEQLSVISGQLKRGPLNVKEILAAPKVQDMLSAQQSMTVEDMHTVAARVAVQAKRKVMLQYGALDRFQMSEMLSEQLGRTIGETRTLGATGLAMFHRVAHEKVMDVVDEGKKLPYVYDGPDDKLTRPFCQELKRQMAKGKVWTRAEIDAMKNGQLADVFTTGGGYNCRHQWRLALDEELPKPTPEELAAIAAKEAAERAAAEAAAKAAAEAAAQKAAEEEAARRTAEEEARQATAAAAWAATEPVSKEVAQKRLAALPVKKGEKKSVHIPVIEPNDAEMKSLASAMKAAEASGVSLADAKPFTLDPGAYTNLKSLERQDWVERAKVSKLIDTFEDWSEGSEHNFAGQNVVLVKHQGELYMSDGHHRATAAKLLGRPMQARLVDLDEAAAKAKALAEAEAAAKAAAEAAAKAKAEAEAAAQAAAAAKAKAEAEAAAKAKAIADTKAALAPHIKKIADGSIHGAKAAAFTHEEAQAMGKLHDELEALEPGTYMPLLQAEITAAKAKQLEAAKQTFAPLFEKKVLKVNEGKLSPDDLKMYLEASDIIKAHGGEAALTAMKAQVEVDAAPLLAAQKLVDLKAQMKPMMAAIMKGEQPSPQFQPLVNELYKLSGGGGEAMSELLSELAAEKDAADKLHAAKAAAKPLLLKDTLNQSLTDEESAAWPKVMKALDEADPAGIESLQAEIKAEIAAAKAAAAEDAARAARVEKLKATGGRNEWAVPLSADYPAYDPMQNGKDLKKQFFTREGGDARKMTPEDAKAEVSQHLTARLAKNTDWLAYAKDFKGSHASQPGRTTELKVMSGIVQTWANTSADHNKLSLAMQYATSKEFGTPYPKFLKESYADEEARLHFEENEDALRAVARAMYDNTQAYFKKHNIKSVWAYRGMTQITPKAWDKKLKEDTTQFGTATVELQPASSFSAEFETSRGFAPGSRGCMIAAEIPVERIMGCCRSGFGCLGETEYVVIGGQPDEDQFFTHAWSDSLGRNKLNTDRKFVEAATLHAQAKGDPNAGAAKKAPPQKVQVGQIVYDLQPGGAYLNSAGGTLQVHDALQAIEEGYGFEVIKPPQKVFLDGLVYDLDGSGYYKGKHGTVLVQGQQLSAATVNKHLAKGDVTALPPKVEVEGYPGVYTLQADGSYKNPLTNQKLSASYTGGGLKDGFVKPVDDAPAPAAKPAPAPAAPVAKDLMPLKVVHAQSGSEYTWNGSYYVHAKHATKFDEDLMKDLLADGIYSPVGAPTIGTSAPVKPDFGEDEPMTPKKPAAAPAPVAGPPPVVVSKKGTVYAWSAAKNGYIANNGNFFTKGEVEGALKAGTFTLPQPAVPPATTKLKQTPVAKPLLVKQQDAVKAAKVSLSKGKKLVDKHVLSLHTMDADQVSEQFSTVQQDALLKAGVLKSWQVDIPS